MKKWPIAVVAGLLALVAVTGAALALMESGDNGDDGSSASRPVDESDGGDTGVAPICGEGAIDCDDTIEEPVPGDPDEPVSSPVTITDGKDPDECNLVHNIDACERQAVDAAVNDLARNTGVAPESITVSTVEFVQWPDACLGVQNPKLVCAEVITPGFSIVLMIGEISYGYRTDATGSIIFGGK